MEEVDNALLRCVEEGSGHGVVLSISTEKLKGEEDRVRSGRSSCQGCRLSGTCAGEKAVLCSKHSNTRLWLCSSACHGEHSL